MDFFAVKVDGIDVIPGICKKVFIYRNSRYDLTFVNFNSKKVHEDDIFVLQDTCILQFFSGESKDCKCLKSP